MRRMSLCAWKFRTIIARASSQHSSKWEHSQFQTSFWAVHRVGTAKAQDRRELDFSVTAFVTDAVTLETVWDDLSDDQQSEIMDAVVSAMTKLQGFSLADEPVQTILEAAGCTPPKGGSRGYGRHCTTTPNHIPWWTNARILRRYTESPSWDHCLAE